MTRYLDLSLQERKFGGFFYKALINDV